MTTEPLALSFGEKLRQTREKRGLSQQEAAKALCLDASIIDALEKEQFDKLPAPVFVRGYIKSYASLLRLVINTPANAIHSPESDSHAHPVNDAETHKDNLLEIGTHWLGQIGLKSLHYGVMIILTGLVFLWWHERYHALQNQNNHNSVISMSVQETPFPRDGYQADPDGMQIIFPEWPL